MFTFNPKDRVYHNFIVSRKPAIIEVSVKYFVMLAMVECVLGPFVYMINYSIFLAKMTNKLYHAKKAELITEKKRRQKNQMIKTLNMTVGKSEITFIASKT